MTFSRDDKVSMKGCLKRVIGHPRLTFDELTEVEVTLN